MGKDRRLADLERAKRYIDSLSKGIDPFTDEELPKESLLNDVRIVRSLFCASDVLKEVIANGGCVCAADRKAFCVTEEMKDSVQPRPFSQTISKIVGQYNEKIDSGNMKKLPVTAVTEWLEEKGFLKKYQEGDGKMQKLPTNMGIKIGMTWRKRKYGDREYFVVLYNKDAQQFVIDHMEDIALYHRNKTK